MTGLTEIMADLYAQGRSANPVTADLIIDRLEAQKNYIPSSELVRREYAYFLLREYRDYFQERANSDLQR